MVSEELIGVRHAKALHAWANHANEGAGDFGLNVSVIPRETGTHNRAGIAGGLEEEIRIAEKR